MAVDYFEELQQEVEREVMACIGCNDCLLACPLPDKHFVTIAQLNAASLATQVMDPQVVDFVKACTQCQQCVPVCPADLHRADMVLWNKMRVEDVEPDRVMPLQVGPNVFQSTWTLDALSNHLAALPLFRGVEATHLRRILLSVTLRRLVPGEVLCREGQFHERLYIVLDGAVQQSTTTIGRQETQILVMGPGSFHGEIAVLGNQQELFTITALADSIVVEFPKAAVFRLMRESQPFDQTMTELYRRRATWTQAKTHPLLRRFSVPEVESLLREATFKVYQPGEVVYLEGSPAADLYIVRSGFLKVGIRHEDRERVLQYFREGDVFGGTALFFGGTQQASVTANTRAEVLAIPGRLVARLLAAHPEVKAELEREATKAEAILREASRVQPVVDDRASSSMIDMKKLVDEGVIQGHEILVIDTSICTNCNNCVDACERRHGYARLDRRGLQLDTMLFPSACRHCEDPVCLMCSVNGIVREPDGEIRIVPDNCIGCGACAARCPYGNIQMHDRNKRFEHTGFSLFSLLGVDRRSTDVDAPLPQESHRDRIAVKCDLCAGYTYYACVHACPVGAAFRINPVETFGRSDLVIGLEMQRAP